MRVSYNVRFNSETAKKLGHGHAKVHGVDSGIWPLVSALVRRGFTTLQSCEGHDKKHGGNVTASGALIWTRNILSPPAAQWLSQQNGIDQVATLWGRERLFPVMEIVFVPHWDKRFHKVCRRIVEAYERWSVGEFADERDDKTWSTP